MDDKIIVSHRGALVNKYGIQGVTKISSAIRKLISADKKRGIKTRVVFLDDLKSMNKIGIKPLGESIDCKSAKFAIDGVFNTIKPDYLMILGGPEIIPHQDLANPAFNAGDDDQIAWGDLPYACELKYNRDTAHFIGPTRVIGRLPDLTGATEPSYLIELVKTASNWKSRSSKEYSKYFALSAFEWKGSTSLSLTNIFGHDDNLLLSPPNGPKYSRKVLKAYMHFINCHGGPSAPEFYGQKGDKYPISLNTNATTGAIQDGTVASVECCYGGQLYDAITLGIDIPICQSYLRQGAYGYFGSTTIAYGPADGNSAADIICQKFLRAVLSGASIGRAALIARQQFVEQSAQMDPIDLKTVAQFCLYGDPSIHPVVPQKATLTAEDKGAKLPTASRFQRSERRLALKLKGDFLRSTKQTASKIQKNELLHIKVKSALARIAVKCELPVGQAFIAYKVKGADRKSVDIQKFVTGPSRYHLAIGHPKSKNKEGAKCKVAIIAKEANGQIIDYRIYYQR